MSDEKVRALSIEKPRDHISAQMAPKDRKSLELSAEDLAQEIKHPRASAVIATLLERERSAPQKGDPAPDFRLPRLEHETQRDDKAYLTLSDHFGKRPVALVFGSYT